MAELPDGCTDDLTIHVCPPQTLEDLVEFILQAEVRKVPSAAIVAELVTKFGLSVEYAELAWDRTLGGLLRAATAANCPEQKKDPVAWISYQRCKREPALIAAIRPEFAKPWWRFW
jgi:hypothetical protein